MRAGDAVDLLRPDGTLRTLAEIERDVLLFGLRQCHGEVSKLARDMDVGRSTLYRHLSETHRIYARVVGPFKPEDRA